VNLERARELGRAALRNIEAHRQRIDDLNVYPVPDGDTGTNLTLTVRPIVEALETSTAETHDELAVELSRAALMGARGNSGVILSQIVRGFANVVGRSDEADSLTLTRAFRSASDGAYRAVRNPVEGTMLTVIREMAEESERDDVVELGPGELLQRVVARGDEALARTREQLDVLREAGVVDAGAAGLVEIVRGLAAGVAGEELPEVYAVAEDLSSDAIHQELSRYRYCTVFVVEGEGLEIEALEAELERLGDSLLVVGDASALKVHVHTDDPGSALAVGTRVGVVEAVEVANMHRQTAERERRLEAGLAELPTLETAVVAVSLGAGNGRLLQGNPGEIRIVEGGQTMNPSTAEIVAAIEATRAREVIVLPNNANVVLAAEQAAEAASKPARVVPTRSLQAGLAAILHYEPTGDAATNEREMNNAIGEISSGEVTMASRNARLDGIAVHEGSWLGLANEKAVAAGDDFDSVAEAVAESLLAGGGDVLTLLLGDEAPSTAELEARLRRRHPLVEIDRHDGGQPHYALWLYA
jgi:uncharacterized protein